MLENEGVAKQRVYSEGGRGMKSSSAAAAHLCSNRKKRGCGSARLLGAERGVELPAGLLEFDMLRPAAFHTGATTRG